MGSEDDDDELAEMRAISRARQQTAEASVFNRRRIEQLKEKQQREREKAQQSTNFFASPPPPIGNPSMETGGVENDDDDDPDDNDDLPPQSPGEGSEEGVDAFEGLRASFPVNFGKQESKVVPLELVHSKTKRTIADGAPSKEPGRQGGGKRAVIQFKLETKKENKAANLDEGGPTIEGEAYKSSIRPGAVTVSTSTSILQGPVPVQGESEKLTGNGERGPGRPAGEDEAGMVTEDAYDDTDDDGDAEKESQKVMDKDADEDFDEDSDGNDDEDEYRVPMTNEVILQGHTRVVSALAIDPSGSRLLSGSYDYTVRMYDFQGMDSKLRSFRQLEPSESHQLRALSFSPSGDLFLAVTGSAQAKVYNRDGFTQGEFIRGDMYIRDLRNTKGHIAGLTGGEWHPRERHLVLTASEDGSLRIWDVNNFKHQKQVVKPKLAKPGRTPVTAVTWGPDGHCVAGGLSDGSLQVWNVKSGWGSRPDLYISGAHEGAEDVTGVLFSADGNTLASRSTDGTLKVWDVRKFQEPLKAFAQLPNSYAQTNMAWSPDERLLITGTSHERGGPGGQLALIDKDRLEVVRHVGVAEDQSVVRVAWHPRLNQIFATSGDKKMGGTHVLYDPVLSERGALACVSRAPRRKRAEDMAVGAAPPVIHNPHALPLFRADPGRKRQREKARKDPVASKRPDLPMSGPGFGGRVGQAKGTLLTQYLLREGGLIKQTWMDEDPREAILRHAEGAKAEPVIMGPAYAATQPKPLFAEEEEEEKGVD